MFIGYARVSTDDQNLTLQRGALKRAGCTKIFEDKVSGSKSERAGLEKAINHARTKDVIVVWRLDRLSRSLKDLIEMVHLLESKKIGLKSLQESIDTALIICFNEFYFFFRVQCTPFYTPKNDR